jgi:glycerophosphoryl diester phosphodiesterase
MFELQSHRGARFLWPENTIAGIEGALALGVDTIEVDAVLTADGLPVLFHDLHLTPALVRRRDGAWIGAPGAAIASLRWADLLAYDVGRLRPATRHASRFPSQAPVDGAGIPRLADACRRLGGTGVRLEIDIKCAASPAATAEAVVAACAAVPGCEVGYRSFNWAVLRRIGQIAPTLPAHTLPAEVAAQAAMLNGGAGPACGQARWAPDHRQLRRHHIVSAHQLGLRVLPWTVNQPRRMAQLIAWRADGLCTDRPDVARAVMQAQGLPLPRPVVPAPTPPR